MSELPPSHPPRPPPKSISSTLDPKKSHKCLCFSSFFVSFTQYDMRRNPKINPNVSGCLRYPLFPNMCSIPLPLRPLDRAYTYCTLLTKYWHLQNAFPPRNPHCRKNYVQPSLKSEGSHRLKERRNFVKSSQRGGGGGGLLSAGFSKTFFFSKAKKTLWTLFVGILL